MVPGFFFLPNFFIKIFANFSKKSSILHKKKRHILKKILIFEVEKSTESFPRTDRAWVDRHSHWYHGKAPPGPIIMIDQSEILSRGQVQFITLFFGGAQMCCAFYQPLQAAQEKPIF
jgi:hypothetical protein